MKAKCDRGEVSDEELQEEVKKLKDELKKTSHGTFCHFTLLYLVVFYVESPQKRVLTIKDCIKGSLSVKCWVMAQICAMQGQKKTNNRKTKDIKIGPEVRSLC